MEELYPPPPSEEEKAKAEKVKEEKAKEAKNGKEKSEDQAPPGPGDTVNELEKAGRFSTWGRGKGTLFLVDAKTRRVLWSTFERPKDLTPEELDRAALRIIEKLRKELTTPAPAPARPQGERSR
jgi:hypothetical protein